MSLHRYLLPPIIFVLAGPGIGGLTMLAHRPPSSLNGGVALGFLFIYLFGMLPASISGCLYVLLWPLTRPLAVLGIHGRGCVTGLATVAPLLLYMALLPHPPAHVVMYLIFAVPAAVCGVLAAKARATGE